MTVPWVQNGIFAVRSAKLVYQGVPTATASVRAKRGRCAMVRVVYGSTNRSEDAGGS